MRRRIAKKLRWGDRSRYWDYAPPGNATWCAAVRLGERQEPSNHYRVRAWSDARLLRTALEDLDGDIRVGQRRSRRRPTERLAGGGRGVRISPQRIQNDIRRILLIFGDFTPAGLKRLARHARCLRLLPLLGELDGA